MYEVDKKANTVDGIQREYGLGYRLRWFREPRIRKAFRIIWNNPKLIFNAIYSLFVGIRLFGIRFFKFPVIADLGSKIRASYPHCRRCNRGNLYTGAMDI
jgi:hypothetical protein